MLSCMPTTNSRTIRPGGGPAFLLEKWDQLKDRPGGKRLFSYLLGRFVPYSGSVKPQVLALEAGYARVQLRDRKAVRNHLRSVHAIALVNVGELASGLAMLAGLPANARGIVVALSAEYLSKARGTLTAECRCKPPADSGKQDIQVVSEIRDQSGTLVCRVRVDWRIGPVESKA